MRPTYRAERRPGSPFDHSSIRQHPRRGERRGRDWTAMRLRTRILYPLRRISIAVPGARSAPKEILATVAGSAGISRAEPGGARVWFVVSSVNPVPFDSPFRQPASPCPCAVKHPRERCVLGQAPAGRQRERQGDLPAAGDFSGALLLAGG